jgi:hypothetical protein
MFLLKIHIEKDKNIGNDRACKIFFPPTVRLKFAKRMVNKTKAKGRKCSTLTVPDPRDETARRADPTPSLQTQESSHRCRYTG